MTIARRGTIGLVVLLVIHVAAGAAFAQDVVDCDLALVLSGGGARGLAHLGVLLELEEQGLRPDCIAGASMGAIIGSLYSAGYEVAEIEALLGQLTWRNLYTEPQNRELSPILHRVETRRAAVRLGIGGGISFPGSILNDALVNRILIEHLAGPGFDAGRSFDRLPIPFRTVGTDLRTGDRVVLTSGDLARAVRSSMSVPLAYPPVAIGEYLLIDGGLVDNVPVGLARDMGARFVIAVDVQTPIERDVRIDVVGVTQRIIDLLYTARNSIHYMEPDLLIQPNVGNHSFADYSGIDELVRAGRESVREVIEAFPDRYRGGDRPGSRSVDGAGASDRSGGGGNAVAGGAAAVPPVGGRPLGERRVASVHIGGNEYLQDWLILREVGRDPGTPFDLIDATEDLDHLRASGLIRNAWLDVLPEGDDEVRLEVRVDEEYRRTVDLGLAYQNDDQVQGFFGFETRNELGFGERLQAHGYASELDLILGVAARGDHLLGSQLGYMVDFRSHREQPKVYVDGDFINRAEFDRLFIGVSTLLQLGQHHLVQFGVRLGRVTIEEELGVDIEAATLQHRLLEGRYVWDDLSSLMLPRRGKRIVVTAARDLEALGADQGTWRAEATGLIAAPVLPRWTVLADFQYGYGSSDLPVYQEFRLGGPRLIPGLDRSEIWGKHTAAASIAVGYDVLPILRAHARVGAGGAWQTFESIRADELVFGGAVGMTAATPLGPIRIDYGIAEGSRQELYFSIGFQ